MSRCKQYYVEEAFNETTYTAGVVRQDNEQILRGEGFSPVSFGFKNSKSVFGKCRRLLQAVRIAVRLQKNDLVVFHFPIQAGIYKFLQYLLKIRGIKTIALIIDIDGIRDNNPDLLKKEIALLKRFKYIVAHNEAMKKNLLQLLPGAKIFCIGLFDYPTDSIAGIRTLSNPICIAANFFKAGYALHLHQLSGLTFNLYGKGYHPGSVKENGNTFYKGVVSPNNLPSKLQGSFGLIWDGDQLETCDQYLKINNPHKCSLYLCAGLPVICWEESALAPFIIKNNIGFTINSLWEIEQKIKAITVQHYQVMQKNTFVIGKKIGEGYYLKNVMGKITQHIADETVTK